MLLDKRQTLDVYHRGAAVRNYFLYYTLNALMDFINTTLAAWMIATSYEQRIKVPRSCFNLEILFASNNFSDIRCSGPSGGWFAGQ
jgi:hypothetical protein